MRLLGQQNMEETIIGGNSNFKFSSTRTEHLGASEYTLVTIAVDNTGSVDIFAKELREALIAAVGSCKKSPRSDNLLLRVVTFSSSFTDGIREIHGFKPLSEINVNDYPQFSPGGSTPLYDVTYSAIGATNAYAERLYKDDYLSNGIVFIITDGDDNASVMSPESIKKEISRGINGEFIESNLVVLIGINAASCQSKLQSFQQNAGLDQYIDAGSATPQKLAKLAAFVSNSVSSQSQALGSGGPSKAISGTI